MDPNATLANIRVIAKEINYGHYTSDEIWSLSDELATMITDLDQWLTQGGFLPTVWADAM